MWDQYLQKNMNWNFGNFQLKKLKIKLLSLLQLKESLPPQSIPIPTLASALTKPGAANMLPIRAAAESMQRARRF